MQAIAIAFVAVFQAAGLLWAGVQAGRAGERLDEALRREGDALVELADAVAAGRETPSDFTMAWRNDFFKARPGTFVPFTLTLNPQGLASRAALLYIRVERMPVPTGGRSNPPFAYETIFPVRIEAAAGHPVRLTRGFAVPPGRYRVIAVLRETAEDPRQPLPYRRAGTLVRQIEVPDFWTGELAVSTVVLADRVEPLAAAIPPAELDEDPYVVGTNRIHPAEGPVFSRKRELVVAFLVYNPSVGSDQPFDLQVDYHLYRKDPGGQGPGGSPPPARGARPGEQYVTRTNPQRFNPSMMGPLFDPAAGTPILAGQGILLANFEAGDYRLEITVTDLLSRKSLTRDVTFAIAGS